MNSSNILDLVWNRLKKYIFGYPWWSALAIIVLIAGVFLFFRSGNDEQAFATAQVKRGEVSQIVSVTGTVRPASEVTLSFEKSGRISAVYKAVGERVSVGTTIATLSNSELSAQLLQAQATVKAEEAKLAELKRGAQPEDITISKTEVENSKTDVINDIRNGYVNSDDAVRNKIDQLFTNPRTDNAKFTFILGDQELKNSLETGRVQVERLLISWNVSLSALSSLNDLAGQIDLAQTNLRAVLQYLDKMALAVNSMTTSNNPALTQTSIDAYKAAVLTARTNVTTAQSSLTAAVDKLTTAESKLALKTAGNTAEAISAQEASLEGSKANVMNLEAQLAKTVLYAPISGIVTKQEAKVGEIVTAATPLVSVISDAKFQIEANIPEADIAKIKPGNNADITLDAYGSDVIFEAVITKIDPAETVIEGISTYKTTLQFKENDARIKSGMTANTDIYGERREAVLYVPGRAIVTRSEGKIVELVNGATTTAVTVMTGLRGSNGEVEVLSGLNEGDTIKIY